MNVFIYIYIYIYLFLDYEVKSPLCLWQLKCFAINFKLLCQNFSHKACALISFPVSSAQNVKQLIANAVKSEKSATLNIAIKLKQNINKILFLLLERAERKMKYAKLSKT